MIRIVLFSLFSASVLMMAQAHGAENDPATQPEAEEKAAPAEETKPAETAARGQKNKSKDKEIFIPSEEISEDFAVSFPVDI